MPVHRITTADPALEHAVRDIERNERIISVSAAGGGCVLVFTEKASRAKPGSKETR